MTLKPSEFILKEGKGQSLDGQVEITSNQSKIQNPLIENETKNKEGLGTCLSQAQEVRTEHSLTLGESLSTTNGVDVTHKTKDQRGQRYQNTEHELTRLSGDFKVRETLREEFVSTNIAYRFPSTSFDHQIKKLPTEALLGRDINKKKTDHQCHINLQSAHMVAESFLMRVYSKRSPK